MSRLNELVEQQVRQYLDVSEEEFEYLRHPSPEHLHDPFYYKDMRELVTALHQFKLKQEKDPSLLLMIDGDYDTDGVLAAAILSAALSVFGFQYRVYIPTMVDGYGISKIAVDKMKAGHEIEEKKIGMILTADNGINAFSGIAYAKSQGIEVLVTDHHPGGEKLPNAKAVVDANRPGDLYPFKGNSGACVAWKVMLAYADLFAKNKKPLIEQLIVFAGMSNVADVMPIRNENRYTVAAAIKKIKEIRQAKSYQEIADTPYPEYNTAFYALYDLITMLQEVKDEKRKQSGKKGTVSLPDNEELISWYLSPLINAPRRVHDTCLESLSIFMVTDEKTRKAIIKRLIELNEEKSRLRDAVLNELPPKAGQCVVCANTRKGISGLIAGKLSEESGLPAFVFSRLDPGYPNSVYTEVPTDGYITSSARSDISCPVNRVIDKINTLRPGLINGGGHATAAGITIEAKNYSLFEQLLMQVIPEIQKEVAEEEGVSIVPENTITLVIHPASITAEYQRIEDGKVIKESRALEVNTFAGDLERTVQFLESLRPFGEQFKPEPKFNLMFDHTVYSFGWNPDFWGGKTFKFNLFGAEVLTFNETWANEVKDQLEKQHIVMGTGKLKLNEFRGNITPQIHLDELE